MSTKFEKLSVLIPIYNEARTLRTIIPTVLAADTQGLDIELICVDDGSADDSVQILRSLAEKDDRIKVIVHPHNRGKGAAIRTAIEHITGDISLVQDADLEYTPSDYPTLLRPILDGKADAVFGTRFATSGQRRVLLYWHGVANHFLTFLTNILNDINLTDMETCYKAVRTDVLKQIPLTCDRFGIEPELTTRLAQWGARLYEVPISYHGRSVAEGKNIGWKDAVAAIWYLFKFRFLSPRFTTHDGYYILQSVRRAKGFNRWMLSQFQDHIGKRVLEAGCGIGNFTELLLDRQRLVCVDHDPFYVETIERRFGHLENIQTSYADLSNPADFGELAKERLDTIISLNVIEHIEADEDVLDHFFNVLQPEGKALILVPAIPSLYSVCDKALGHYRRYTPTELREKMIAAGFTNVRVNSFNRFGVLGWLVNKVLKKPDLSPRQMRIYDRLLPIAKIIDRLGIGPGLSLIAIGQKPVDAPVKLDWPDAQIEAKTAAVEPATA